MLKIFAVFWRSRIFPRDGCFYWRPYTLWISDSKLAESRSCGLHCRLTGHAWLHLWVIDKLSYCR